ncbi:MAG: hypothetical protein L3K16_00800 [Thermoplasmata archaeon]|nr:hypothetical protein [Thermoplasmata archaeon]
MPPIPAPEGRTLWIVGARRTAPGKPTRSQLIETLRTLGKAGPELVALFDARSIASERHILSAWAHLGRSRARGEERLRDRGAEFALFVAGDDQLPRALQKVGFQNDTEAFVVVGERPRLPADVLASFGLKEDPTAYPRPLTAETLDRLGITSDDRQVVPEPAWEGLVLERIAMLELSAAHTPGRPAAQTS